MTEIIKSYKQPVPALRFIGKKYGDEDRVDGGFGAKWGEWFTNGWFETLEKSCDIKATYEDGDAYIGLMRWKEGESFQYWIGIFMPKDATVPEGFDFIDFDAATLGVCWVYGKEPDVYMKEALCGERLKQDGCEIVADMQDAWWFFERYGCPRFTTPDEQGNIILDICHYVK